MKIILIGASGDIGKAAYSELSPRHEIISVGRNSGDVHVDMSDRESVVAMYKTIGKIDAVVSTAGAATANGAIGGFVVGSAIEMPRGIRINAVSPGLLDVSEKRYGKFFPGHERVAAERVGLAYTKSIEGPGTGQIIIVD